MPSAFETCATATSRVRSVSSAWNAPISSSPLGSTGTARSRAPLAAHTICHGTMLEWCSSSVIRTSSPASQRTARVAVRDQIDGLGGSSHEHDLAHRACVDEAANGLARALEGFGSPLAQAVHASMYVRVQMALVVLDRAQHR